MQSHSSDIKILKQHLSTWDDLTEDQITFERLPSLSNIMWKVTALSKAVEPRTVIYRKLCAENDFLDRSTENYIVNELSKSKLGPKCFGYSSIFRIEEYYECTPVSRTDLRNSSIRRTLAKNLAALHSLNLSKMNQQPCFLSNIKDRMYTKEINKKLLLTEFTDSEQKIIFEIEKALFSKSENDFLLSILPKNPESITFSHNDLHAGNILHLKNTDDYLFIDHEYSCYNYRGFDIANLFVETVFDYQYNEYPYYKVEEEAYPPQDELEDFIKYYTFFKIFGANLDKEEASKVIDDVKVLNQCLEKTNKTKEFSQQMEQILYEAFVGKLLSHYHWTLWSVTFSKKEGTQFDYIAYAYDRMKLYQKTKEEFLANRLKTCLWKIPSRTAILNYLKFGSQLFTDKIL